MGCGDGFGFGCVEFTTEKVEFDFSKIIKYDMMNVG